MTNLQKKIKQALTTGMFSMLMIGCSVTVNAEVSSPQDIDRVEVRVVDDEGNTVASQTSTPIRAGEKWQGTLEAAPGQRLEAIFKYPSGASSTTAGVVPLKTDSPWSWQVTAERYAVYDPKAAQDRLKQLAMDLSADGPNGIAYRLSDVMKMLGTLIIIPPGNSVSVGGLKPNDVVDFFPYADPVTAIESVKGKEASGSVKVQKSSSVGADLNIAVFGSVGAKLDSDDLYDVRWQFEHDEILEAAQVGMHLANLAGNAERMKALELLARMHPNAEVWVISNFHVIRNGAVSVTKGKKLTSTGNISSAVFTSDAAYTFDSSEQELYGVNDYVVSWKSRLFNNNLSELYRNLSDPTLKSSPPAPEKLILDATSVKPLLKE